MRALGLSDPSFLASLEVGGGPAGQFTAYGRTDYLPQIGTWTVPAGVTSICVVLVGAGAGGSSFTVESGKTDCGGGGGGCIYCNNVAVTPGETFTYNLPPRGEDGDEDDAPAGSPDDPDKYGYGGYQHEDAGADYYQTRLRRSSKFALAALSGNGGRDGDGHGGSYSSSSEFTEAIYEQGGDGVMTIGVPTPRGLYQYTFGFSQEVGTGGSVGGVGKPSALRIIWGQGRAFPNTNVGDI